MPVNVRQSNKEQSSKALLESCLDAYFKDQKLRQARKAQSQVGCIDVPIETSRAKKKKRISRAEYYKMVKRNQRGKKGLLAKECAAKAITRKKPGVLAKECAEKKLARQILAFKASENEHQRASKQKIRKKPGVLAKECAVKKLARQIPAFKASENEHQCASKQKIRKKARCTSKRIC